MEFVNRVKQRLAEFEGDPEDYPENDTSEDIECLKSEIIELKTKLNSNYDVYVRRLEKRKNKIHDLETKLESVSFENDELRQRVEETERYKVQLGDCKEQLEQLENCQNQELGKIKHMLLSAETALEIERQKNRDIAFEKQSNLIEDSNVVEKTIEMTEECSTKKHLEIQTELSSRDFDDTDESAINNLKTKIVSLEAEVQKLRQDLTETTLERDSIRNSYLEAEIASHECDNTRIKESQDMKLELAKTQAALETLKVTLEVRDNELKIKKEDVRREKEENDNLSQTINTKNMKLSAFESEISSLKESLSERLLQMRSLQVTNDKLEIEIEDFKQNKADDQKKFEGYDNEISKYQERCAEFSRQNDVGQQCIGDLQQIISSHIDENRNLKLEMEKLKEELCQQNNQCKLIMDETKKLKDEKSALERSIPGLIQTSELVRNLQSTVNILEDELEEKRQAVRQLQIRANEMKKMLQKELKPSPTPPPSSNPQESSMIFLNGGGVPNISHNKSPSPPLMAARRAENCDDVELTNMDKEEILRNSSTRTDSGELEKKYLRHLIFKFLTSPEVEAKQMIRAVATLLQFNNEEEKLLEEYLDWKSSWFGVKPRIPN